MSRRSFTRVLLSLLLLISQQMAMTHVISHVAGALDTAAQVQQGEEDDDSGLSNAIAKDQSCHQCLAFAQIATALGNTPRYFAATDIMSRAGVSVATQAGCTRTVCVFQSRAPPLA